MIRKPKLISIFIFYITDAKSLAEIEPESHDPRWQQLVRWYTVVLCLSVRIGTDNAGSKRILNQICLSQEVRVRQHQTPITITCYCLEIYSEFEPRREHYHGRGIWRPKPELPAYRERGAKTATR